MLYIIYGLLISALSTSQMAWPFGKMSMMVPPLVVALVEKYNWLVVFRHPSEKSWSSSVWMIIPSIWNNKIHVPNHQITMSCISCIFLVFHVMLPIRSGLMHEVNPMNPPCWDYIRSFPKIGGTPATWMMISWKIPTKQWMIWGYQFIKYLVQHCSKPMIQWWLMIIRDDTQIYWGSLASLCISELCCLDEITCHGVRHRRPWDLNVGRSPL